MRRYENIDVIAALGAVMEINTEHYKSDFKYDVEMFKEAATEPNGENNRLLWLSRPSGTECFWERSASIKDTAANNSWSYYAGTNDNILAYAVEITGMENGKPTGNLYELDYRRQVEQLNKVTPSPVAVTLFLADGTQKALPYEEYKNRWSGLSDRYGKIDRVRFEVADENGLQQSLKQAREERQKYTPTVFKLRNISRKPSIKAQLAEGKTVATEPKKAATKTKSNDMEV